MEKTVYSFVIPIYNEGEALWELEKRMKVLLDSLEGSSEVILVDDGSTDDSPRLLESIHQKDPRFKILRLSRNFGQQIAITAGLDHAAGQATVILDADLQDPPEIVLEMVKLWKQGYEMVYGLREGRRGESWLKGLSARLFYRLFNRFSETKIPVDVGEFRLIDRKVLKAFQRFREKNRFNRGLFCWLGFKQIGIPYVREGRAAGRSHYSLKKMFKLAADGVFSFSYSPLRLVLKTGLFVSVLAFLGGIVTLLLKGWGFGTAFGWSSIAVVVVISFLTASQLLVLGVMSEYMERISHEVKGRPLYLVNNTLGLPVDPQNDEEPSI